MALILALVLCVGILAGCEQKPAETSKPTDAPKPTETQKPTEPTVAPTEPPVTEYTFPAGAQLDVYAGHADAVNSAMLNDFVEEATGLDILWLSAPEDGGIDALLTEKVTPAVVWGFYGFLLGKKDINSDADWQAFKDELVKYGQAELVAAAQNAYAQMNG